MPLLTDVRQSFFKNRVGLQEGTTANDPYSQLHGLGKDIVSAYNSFSDLWSQRSVSTKSSIQQPIRENIYLLRRTINQTTLIDTKRREAWRNLDETLRERLKGLNEALEHFHGGAGVEETLLEGWFFNKAWPLLKKFLPFLAFLGRRIPGLAGLLAGYDIIQKLEDKISKQQTGQVDIDAIKKMPWYRQGAIWLQQHLFNADPRQFASRNPDKTDTTKSDTFP